MNALKMLLLLSCLLPIRAAVAFDVTVVGPLARQLTMEPGGVETGTILIQNTSQEPREVALYLRDYLFTADGTSRYPEVGTVERTNGPWIHLTPERLTLPPGAEAEAYYAVQVPADASLRGTYWSVIMVEPTERIEAPVATHSVKKAQVTVRTIMRYGVQIITDIGATGIQRLAFEGGRLGDGGGDTLEFAIANVGERGAVPAVWVDVFDAYGRPLGRHAGPQRRILPGCSVRYEVEVGALPSGTYTALVVADAGDDYVVGSRFALQVP